MKLDTFPPGQDATRIIPKAIIGEMKSPHAIIRSKVRAGSRIIWHTIPVMIDFGFVKMSTNVEGLIPSATPNITNARTILRSVEPPFIVTSIASRLAITSGLIMIVF
jgi:hypothetical protein